MPDERRRECPDIPGCHPLCLSHLQGSSASSSCHAGPLTTPLLSQPELRPERPGTSTRPCWQLPAAIFAGKHHNDEQFHVGHGTWSVLGMSCGGEEGQLSGNKNDTTPTPTVTLKIGSRKSYLTALRSTRYICSNRIYLLRN